MHWHVHRVEGVRGERERHDAVIVHPVRDAVLHARRQFGGTEGFQLRAQPAIGDREPMLWQTDHEPLDDRAAIRLRERFPHDVIELQLQVAHDRRPNARLVHVRQRVGMHLAGVALEDVYESPPCDRPILLPPLAERPAAELVEPDDHGPVHGFREIDAPAHDWLRRLDRDRIRDMREPDRVRAVVHRLAVELLTMHGHGARRLRGREACQFVHVRLRHERVIRRRPLERFPPRHEASGDAIEAHIERGASSERRAEHQRLAVTHGQRRRNRLLPDRVQRVDQSRLVEHDQIVVP